MANVEIVLFLINFINGYDRFVTKQTEIKEDHRIAIEDCLLQCDFCWTYLHAP